MSQATLQLAEIVELIGRLWLREVTIETLAAMQVGEFRQTYEELGGFIPTHASDDVVEELAVEYCRLLIGPQGQISPVQSVWATDQFQSKTAASMNRFIELLPGYQSESSLPDHIGVELDFLSALLRRSDESMNEVVNHFVNQHLRWTKRFLERVSDRDDSRFYQGLAKVTQQLVASFD